MFFIIVLEIYSTKSLLDFSRSKIIISCINYILILNLSNWVVANHKSSKCPIFNSNPYESLVKNLLKPF